MSLRGISLLSRHCPQKYWPLHELGEAQGFVFEEKGPPLIYPSIEKNPLIFGPLVWGDLKKLAAHLDGGFYMGTQMRRLIHTLPEAIPCGSCSKHFARLIRTHPPPIGNSACTWLNYIISLHNQVSIRIYGKEGARVYETCPANQSPQEHLLSLPTAGARSRLPGASRQEACDC